MLETVKEFRSDLKEIRLQEGMDVIDALYNITQCLARLEISLF
jgi:hypothetical protein